MSGSIVSLKELSGVNRACSYEMENVSKITCIVFVSFGGPGLSY